MSPSDFTLDYKFAFESDFFEFFQKFRESDSAVADLYLEKLTDEMKNNLQKWWTVAEMAEFCGLSEAHFRRIFHSSVGSSPKNYIDRLKIQKVAETLCCSAETVKDVAVRFGYVDPFHFSKRFKQLTGFSPDAYRKQTSNWHFEAEI